MNHLSNLPTGVTDEMHEGVMLIPGECCTFCKEEKFDDELAAEGITPVWDVRDWQNRPFCTENCRIEQAVHEGASRDQLRELHDALQYLANVSTAAWFSLELMMGDAIALGVDEDHKHHFASLMQFRNGVDDLLKEMGASEDTLKWAEGGAR